MAQGAQGGFPQITDAIAGASTSSGGAGSQFASSLKKAVNLPAAIRRKDKSGKSSVVSLNQFYTPRDSQDSGRTGAGKLSPLPPKSDGGESETSMRSRKSTLSQEEASGFSSVGNASTSAAVDFQERPVNFLEFCELFKAFSIRMRKDLRYFLFKRKKVSVFQGYIQ